MHFNSGLPGRTVQEHSSGGQFSVDLDAVTPMLENTWMHAHCRSNFYINNSVHHEGYRLSSSRYYSHCIETASIIRNHFSMTDSVEVKQYNTANWPMQCKENHTLPHKIRGELKGPWRETRMWFSSSGCIIQHHPVPAGTCTTRSRHLIENIYSISWFKTNDRFVRGIKFRFPSHPSIYCQYIDSMCWQLTHIKVVFYVLLVSAIGNVLNRNTNCSFFFKILHILAEKKHWFPVMSLM